MAKSSPMDPFSLDRVRSLLLLLLLLLSVGAFPEASFLFRFPVKLLPGDWLSASLTVDGVDVDVELGVNVVTDLVVVVVVVAASVASWNRVKLTIDLPGIGCLAMCSCGCPPGNGKSLPLYVTLVDGWVSSKLTISVDNGSISRLAR